MKKSTLASTLLLACLALFVACSAYQPDAKRYQVEKAFFAAEKAVTNYSVKPELRSSQDYLNLVSGYRKVYAIFEEEFPGLDSKDSLTQTEKEAAMIAGRAQLTAADLLLSAGEVDSAMVILHRVVNTKYLSPQNRSQALLSIGRNYERLGDWEDAEKSYTQLIEMYYPPVVNGFFPAMDVIALPRQIVEYYATIGDSLTADKKADWAEQYYQKIISSFPHSPLTVASTRLLAETYNFKGQYQRSVDLLMTVKDSTGNVVDAAKGMMADLYFMRLDRKDDAHRIYEDLVANAKDSLVIASSLLKLATIEISNKRFDSGREYLRKLSSAFPNSQHIQIQSQQLLAQSFEEQGQYDRAQQEYLSLINGYPNTQQSIEAMMYMPDFFKKIGQPILAQQWVGKTEDKLKEVITTSSDKRASLMASSYLASFYAHNALFDQAIKQFTDLRQQFPKSAQAADALLKVGGIYEFNKKDRAKAIETYREFVKQYPNSVVRQRVEEEIMKLQKG